MIFYAAEINASTLGVAVFNYSLGWGATPWGTLAELPDDAVSDATIYASDIGYRTAPSDDGGPNPYPPTLAEAFAVTRAVNLTLASSTVASAWGTLMLSNASGDYDSLVANYNNDGRALRVLYGAKTLSSTRLILTDPSYSTLQSLFAGVSTLWSLTDTALKVPLRDATYWLERPLQSAQYLGTGTYEGDAVLTGAPKPKTRGTAYNVTPVLIDATNRIYQYSDGPGTVTALYEGSTAVFVSSGNTTDLYSGSTASGHYRTDNSRGLFQLGATPVAAITADVTGAFPVAGSKTNWADIAYYLLTEDLALAVAYVDAASFAAAASAYAYTAGVYFGPQDAVDGAAGVDRLLAGVGAKMYPGRDGALRVYVLRDLGASPTAVASWSTVNAVSVTPRALAADLSPPLYRARVGYQHNYTVQTSGFNGSVTIAQQQFVAAADRYAAALSSTVQSTYRRPNDAAPISSALTSQANAQSVATDLIALWGVRRRLYDVTVAVDVALARDIGDVIFLTWPLDDLSTGQYGQIVGDAFRSEDSTVTFQVLV